MPGKSHKKLIMFLIIMMALAGTGFAGYLIARNEPRIAAKPEPDVQQAAKAGTDEARIESGARIIWEYKYAKCAHQIIAQGVAGDDMAGLTFTELTEQHPELTIIAFDTDEVSLRKKLDGYCPNHYILKLSGDTLAVYQTVLGTTQQKEIQQIDIDWARIDTDERRVLQIGKVFGSLEDIESYIEDIET